MNMNVFDYVGKAKRYIPLLGFLFGGVAYGQSTYVAPSTWDMSKTNAIINSTINQENGIAGLDGNRNVTAPINTLGGIASQGYTQLGSTPAMPVLPSDLGTSTSDSNIQAPVLGFGAPWGGDGFYNPNKMMIGGHVPSQDGQLSVFGAPYSYGDLGTAVNIGIQNGIWAGQRGGAGGFDALNMFLNAGNTAPYYKIGQDFTDDTGATHTLTFDANGVTVTPALPQSWISMWNALKIGQNNGPGMVVFTNMLADTNGYTNVAASPGWAAHTNSDLWHGYVQSYTQNGTASTHLNMPGGWHPESAWVGAYGPNNNVIPDTSNGLDQKFYSAYTHPILMLGTSNQQFHINSSCVLFNDGSNYNGGTRYNQVIRDDQPLDSCQGWEADFKTPDGVSNGWEHLQGVTMDLAGGSSTPSPDSVSFSAQGNWPTGYGTGLGTDGVDFRGGTLGANSRRGPAGTVGLTTEIGELMQGADAPTDIRSNMIGIRVLQNVDTVGSQAAGVHSPGDNSVHIGEWVGGNQFGVNGTTLGQYGTYMGDLVFNPGWLKGGVSICGSQNGDTNVETACLGVSAGGIVSTAADINDGGSLSVHGNMTIGGNGGTTTLKDPVVASSLSGPSGVLPFSGYWQFADRFHIEVPQGDITGTANGAGVVTTGGNDHSWLTFAGGHYIFDETASGTSVNDLLDVSDVQVKTYAPIVAPSYLMSALPTANLSDGAMARCTDCKLNGGIGVTAFWNATSSKWTDSQNNDLSN